MPTILGPLPRHPKYIHHNKHCRICISATPCRARVPERYRDTNDVDASPMDASMASSILSTTHRCCTSPHAWADVHHHRYAPKEQPAPPHATSSMGGHTAYGTVSAPLPTSSPLVLVVTMATFGQKVTDLLPLTPFSTDQASPPQHRRKGPPPSLMEAATASCTV
jgi:hypothetical protein